MKDTKVQKKYLLAHALIGILFALVLVVGFSRDGLGQVSAANKIGYVNYSYLRLREKPTVESRVVEVLDRNDELEILETGKEWYKVIATHGGKKLTGYVAVQYVGFKEPKKQEAAYVNEKADFLNVRKGPGVSYDKILGIQVYQKIIVTDKCGNGWLKIKVTVDNKTYTGYVNGAYITYGAPPKKPADDTGKGGSPKPGSVINGITVGKSNGKTIYLTFDDGPGPYTKKLLDVLDKYQVKATFFVTNQSPKYQSMIKEEAKRGHTVALHSYSHNYKTCYSSVEGYFKDLEKMQDVLKKQGVKRSDLIRFPGGSSNAVSKRYCKGIMTKLTKEVVKRGYNYSDWNVTSGDAGETTSTTQVVKNIKNGCSKNKVSIVLQHDIKSFSVNAVEEVLRWGLQNGYTFKAMTKNSVVKHGRLNN